MRKFFQLLIKFIKNIFNFCGDENTTIEDKKEDKDKK